MKKSILLMILGGTMVASSSQAQGVIAFSSYSANAGAGAITTFLGGGVVPDGFTAQLYYALGTVSDPVNDPLSPITGLIAVGAPVTYDTAFNGYPGYFTGANVIIPGYQSGPVSFEVLTTGTASGVAYQGRSGAFTMDSIPGSALPSIFMSGMPDWQVAPVPEPTTLALAGLGGLASLVAFRRKQA